MRRLRYLLIILFIFSLITEVLAQTPIFEKIDGLYGGGISAFAVSPTNDSILYAGTDGGLVFKSIDGGNTWTKILTSNSAIISFIFDPQTYDLNYVVSAIIWKKQGNSWNRIDSYNNYTVLGLIITGDTLYLATHRGIFKKVGNGNWQQDNLGLSNNDIIIRLVLGPNNRIYVLTSNYRLYTKYGDNWGAMPMPGGATRIYSITFNPRIPNAIYAGTDRGIYKKEGEGVWRLLAERVYYRMAVSPDEQTLYAYDTGLIAKKVENQEWQVQELAQGIFVYSLTLDRTGRYIYAATNDGIYKQALNQNNWHAMNNGLSGHTVFSLAYQPHTQTLYAGTGWGLYIKQPDSPWVYKSESLHQHISALLFDDNFSTLYGGGSNVWQLQQDNWTETEPFVEPFNDFLRFLVLDSARDVLYAFSWAYVYQNNPENDHWVTINQGLPQNIWLYGGVFSPHENRLYLATSQGIYRTNTNNIQWEAFSRGLELGNNPCTSLYTSNQVIYTTCNHVVYQKTLDSRRWEQVSHHSIIVDSFVSNNEGNTFYVGNHTGIYRKHGNGEAPWMLIEETKDYRIKSLLLSPDGVLYVGTPNGVFQINTRLFVNCDNNTNQNAREALLCSSHLIPAIQPLDPIVDRVPASSCLNEFCRPILQDLPREEGVPHEEGSSQPRVSPETLCNDNLDNDDDDLVDCEDEDCSTVCSNERSVESPTKSKEQSEGFDDSSQDDSSHGSGGGCSLHR